MVKWQAYLAEFIGTFFLALAVGLSVVGNLPIVTPVIAGLTLMLFVYTIGPITGAQINPAVTIALATIGKVAVLDAVIYVVVQILGGLAALGVIYGMTGGVVALSADASWMVFVAEAIGAFVLVFGISAVVHGRVDDDAGGVVIGGSLLLGILVAASFSAGVLNPAVALALGTLNWAYALAPLVGTIAAAWVYKALVMKVKK